ncbi:MAG TPA: beta-aspartyl-peptidase [Desulfobacterales bacterium]|nr:beta-aspartyl-peptidase [Desulfobacterales bacterium]
MKPADAKEKPMFTLITGGSVYAPDKLGRKEILIAGGGIARIAERIDLPAEFKPRVIRATGKTIVPGLVDLHVHLLGGGGEAGPWSRTPEISLSKITRAGVTTVVGLLGTDDVSRRPETLLAKAMQLEQEGVSAYIYSGSYQLPLATITGSLRKDIALIPKVVGVGEVAVSDHRSSQPSFEELCRIAAEARVGGMLGGKAGLVHLHMGAGSRRLDPVIRMVQETEIPIGQFLPTHLNRTRSLMEQAIEFAKLGGNIDITASGKDLHFHPTSVEAIRMALDAGISVDQISLSSDSNGSMPVFDEKGNVVKLGVGDIQCMFDDWQLLVKTGLSLEESLKIVTANPAKRVGLFESKGGLAPGKDADLLILGPDLEIDSVIAKGRLMVHEQEIIVKGTFEG